MAFIHIISSIWGYSWLQQLPRATTLQSGPGSKESQTEKSGQMKHCILADIGGKYKMTFWINSIKSLLNYSSKYSFELLKQWEKQAAISLRILMTKAEPSLGHDFDDGRKNKALGHYGDHPLSSEGRTTC